MEEPTEGVTVTAWDSREDAEAYAAQSGPFKELLGKFERWHTRPAEVRTYEVVGGGE
jgi:heme-degrading monooxygenase HmoA